MMDGRFDQHLAALFAGSTADDGGHSGRSGRESDRLFAIGPVSRAAFWKIPAVPDIRGRAQKLAVALFLD